MPAHRCRLPRFHLNPFYILRLQHCCCNNNCSTNKGRTALVWKVKRIRHTARHGCSAAVLLSYHTCTNLIVPNGRHGGGGVMCTWYLVVDRRRYHYSKYIYTTGVPRSMLIQKYLIQQTAVAFHSLQTTTNYVPDDNMAKAPASNLDKRPASLVAGKNRCRSGVAQKVPSRQILTCVRLRRYS